MLQCKTIWWSYRKLNFSSLLRPLIRKETRLSNQLHCSAYLTAGRHLNCYTDSYTIQWIGANLEQMHSWSRLVDMSFCSRLDRHLQYNGRKHIISSTNSGWLVSCLHKTIRCSMTQLFILKKVDFSSTSAYFNLVVQAIVMGSSSVCFVSVVSV